MHLKSCKILFFITTLVYFTSCQKDTNVIGWKPIYMSNDSLYAIYNLPPQPIIQVGSLYSWNNYLFINEINKGIHIIDQTNPSNAVNISFIRIWGNKNFSVYDSTLYADNGRDLITLDIRDVMHVAVLDIQKYALRNENIYPDSLGYFECVDTENGIVTNWIKTQLTNPKCLH